MQLTYGYSATDILFLRTISRLATLFGVVPSYNYENRNLSYKKLYRCYALYFAFTMTSLSMTSLYYRFEYDIVPIVVGTMDSLMEITGVILCVVNSLSSSFWNMKNWHELITRLSRLERPSNLNTRGTRNKNIKKNPLMLVVIGCICHILISVWTFLSVDRSMFLHHVSHIIQQHIKFASMIMIYHVALSIKEKYRGLNNLLLTVNSTSITKKDFLRIIRKVRILNLELDSIVGTFNLFFGWPVLFILAHSFIQILGSLSLLTTKSFDKFGYMDLKFVCYMAGDAGVILITICGCDNALEASREIFRNCCELKAAFPLQSKEMEELEKLQTTFQKQTKFTAAEFFEINRSLLLSILSTITTYMIVIIQFNSIKSNNSNKV